MMSDRPQTSNVAETRLLQINLNKSKNGQLELINAIKGNWDILAIQEPYINSVGNTRASQHWASYYPSTKLQPDHDPIRTVILINSKIQSEHIEQLHIASSDITAIKISAPNHSLTIFNIYNDCNHSRTITVLHDYITRNRPSLTPTETDHFVICGDFNRHHPMWEEQRNAHLNSRQELINPLLDMIVDLGLIMELPPNIPTLQAFTTKNWTRTDNIWRSGNTTNPFTICRVNPSLRPILTDHIPIESVLSFPVSKLDPPPRYNFHSADMENFREHLITQLPAIKRLDDLKTSGQIDQAVTQLTGAIQNTIAQVVKLSTPIPFECRWWTKELTDLRKRKNRLSRDHMQWRGLPSHPCHEEYHDAAESFKQTLHKQQEEHFTEWLAGVTNTNGLWDANKYITEVPNDYSRQRIPALINNEGVAITSNEEKSQALANAFFPPPPPNPHTFPPTDTPTVGRFTPYSNERILRAIRKLKAHKAPGPDGIPNFVIISCADLLVDHLQPIYQAIITTNIYPASWKQSDTIVLRKPGKTAYNIANSYRPIALLNTLAKLLSTLVAEDISFLCEVHHLLPATQFGGRPGRTTTDALHLLTQQIKKAWRSGDVVSPILLHDMRRKGIPEEYVKFTDSLLTGRSTRLKFDDYTSLDIPINNGNSQGCPLSMLYYAIYIASLLEVTDKHKNESACGFVDNTHFIARGKSFDETHNMLKSIMERENGALFWSTTHNSPFELSKLAVMNFTHSKTKTSSIGVLTIEHNSEGNVNATVIPNVNTYKLLGVYLDVKLMWTAHHNHVLKRAVRWTALFCRMNKITRGLPQRCARQLYLAVAVPRITYAADIWYIPTHNNEDKQRTAGMVGLTRKINSIQRAAAIAITGALRSTAGDIAMIHADLYDAGLTLLDACHRAAVRLAALPKEHPLKTYVNHAALRVVKSHATPLHILFSLTSIDPHTTEVITPARYSPEYNSPIATIIDDEKEQALTRNVGAHNGDCVIYADGSGYEGGIGAAAVLYTDGVERESLKLNLGTTDEHTVFEGELAGVLLGLHLVEKGQPDANKVTIFIDNQAAISTITKRKPIPSQYLVNEIQQAAMRLNEYEVEMIWIPGHKGAAGNDRADELAKEAAKGASSDKKRLPTIFRKCLPTSTSATRQRLKAKVNEQWKDSWKSSPRFRKLAKIDGPMPAKTYARLIAPLNRTQASTLTQLRTNHYPLNSYLHRIKRSDHASCDACADDNAIEDIAHFLFTCPAYRHARLKLARATKRDANHLD